MKTQNTSNKILFALLTMILVIVISVLTTFPIIAAQNNPGHDSLYIEQTGDSELNGNLNITGNLTLQDLITQNNLVLRGDGVQSGTKPRIIGSSGYLSLQSPGDIYINTLSGTTSTVNLGDGSDSVNLAVTGALTVDGTLNAGGQGVCLANGTNCPAGAGETGTVTSVGMTTPTGLTVSGSPITTSGTLALSLQSGYSIPTTTKQGQWDQAYTHITTDVIETATDVQGVSVGGEVSGTIGNIVINNDALDDQYYDSESDLTGLLDDNYVDVSGDTMTDSLTIQKSGGGATLNLGAETTNYNDTAMIILQESASGTYGTNSYGFRHWFDGDANTYYFDSVSGNSNIVTAYSVNRGSSVVDFKGTPTMNGNNIWHEGNDGSGSGLDADTIDGNNYNSNWPTTAANIGAASTNIETDGTIRWEDAAALTSTGALSVDYIAETELDTIAELNTQITDATLCQSDGTNCPADNTGTDDQTLSEVLGQGTSAGGQNIDALGNIDFGSSTGDKAYWYGTTYATGIESSTLYWETGTNFRWYNSAADAGTSDIMQLSASGLQLETDFDLQNNALLDVDWSTSDDGSGSGLDADLLDNLNSAQFLRSDSSDTMDAGTNTALTILSDDAGTSELQIRGDGQGTGKIYLGQSTTHGGGLIYNGDGTPTEVGSTDHISIYRRTSGTDTAVLEWVHNSNTAEFRGDIDLNNNALTNVDWSTSDDGTGSGLDADLLDGHDSTYFATAASSSDDQTLAEVLAQGNDANNLEIVNVNGIRLGSASSPGSWQIHASGQAYIADFLRADGGITTNATDPGTGNAMIGGIATVGGQIRTDEIRDLTGQQLVLSAGESYAYATGQTGEYVYVNAENGLQIATSPDNWATGWAGRDTTTISGTAITIDGNTAWHAGNDGASSGLDADLLDGYTSATSATANTIALRDSNADISQRYGHAQYFSMSHGASTRNSDTVFYSSTDNYIRKNTDAGFRTSLNVPTRTGGDASGTWGISITGNSDTVDSLHAASFMRSDADDSFTGKLTASATDRRSGIYGTYDSTKIDHVWSMGTAYDIASDGSTFGDLYGLAYCHTNNANCKAGLGHQLEFVNNGVVGAAIGFNGGIWTSGAITGATINTGSGAKKLGDAAVANGDTNSIPTSDQVYDFVIGQGYSTTSGTVTSVDMTTPTGLTVSGNPITTSGTLALSLQSGYSIPTNTKQTQWDTAYTERGSQIAGNRLSWTTGQLHADPTNLGLTGSGNSRTITSSTGTNIAIPTATTSNAGFLSTTDKTKLDGIETGATADQTAADIRALGFFDTTNDGSTSGLDADLIDGKNALAWSSGGSIDVNAANPTQLYAGSTGSWTNRGPAGNNAGGLLNINTHSGNYFSQLWFDTAADEFYFRSANNALPTGSWQKVYHSGNDPFDTSGEIQAVSVGGEVSGTIGNIVINNDALDDQYYDSESDLTALLNDNYVDVSGDTMSGTLNMNNNLITNVGNAGTDFTSGGGLNLAGDLNLNGRTYTLNNIRTFENVASYYSGSTPATGTVVIEIDNTPNMMLEAEIVIQGYNGLTTCQVRGYTYTGSTTWHQPAATCLSSGHSGGYTVRFGKRSADNDRVIMIGTTGSSWGNYPHVAVTRVTYGYPGSGSSPGDWSISIVTDESAYSSISNVNENSGFEAHNAEFSGSLTLPTSSISGAGSGSGLDADLLDGQSGAYYLDNTDTQLSEAQVEGYIFDTDNTGSMTTTGTLRADGGLYVGDDEYFWSDSEDRIATTDDFYVQSSSSNTYLYSTNTYLGASSGDNIYVRGNTISGNSWSITGAGAITGATINTGSGAKKLGDAAVANGDTNSIPTSDQVYDFVMGQGFGDVTSVGSMTSGAVFADSTADDDWFGLGSSAGRIEFDKQATDEVNILDANVGIGTSTPTKKLDVSGSGGSITLDPDSSDQTISTTNNQNLTITSSGGSVIVIVG